MMMLKDQLDQLKNRLSRKEFGREFVPLPTKSVIDLIEAHNDLYEALEAVLDAVGALSKPHELFGYGMNDDDVYSVFSALAKARGEQ